MQVAGGAIEPSSFQAPRESAPVRQGDLDVCPACASGLVYPVTWEPAGGEQWSVSLRCPECEWSGGGTYGQRAIDRFDEVLERGAEAILDDLRALARANIEGRIDRFVAALASDAILPEDF